MKAYLITMFILGIINFVGAPATLEEKLRLGNTACRTIYTTDVEDEKLWEIAALMAL